MSAVRNITVLGVFKTFIITVMLMVALIFGASYLYINEAGGLRRLLESELTRIVGNNGSVTVGGARLRLSLSRQPLHLAAEDIVVKLERDQIDLPSADISFGLKSLLGGGPETVLLRGIKLDLVKTSSGWSGSPAIIFLDQLVKQSGRNNRNLLQSGLIENRLGGLKLIAVETDRLSLSDEAGRLPKLTFADIYIDVTSGDNDQVRGSLRAQRLNADGGQIGNFTLSFDGWPGSEHLAFDMSASQLQTADISGYIEKSPAALRQIGVLSGHLGLEMKGGQVNKLNADVALVDGTLGIPGVGLDAAFDTAELAFSYGLSSDSLTISKAALNFADKRRLSFDGIITQFHQPSSAVKGVIEANNLPLESLFDDWPDTVAPALKQSLKQRFNGGQFKLVKAEFGGEYRSQTSALQLSGLELESQFSGVRANLSGGQYQRIVSTVGGTLGMKIGKGGRVENVAVDLDITDGSILLADYGRSVSVPSGQLKSGLRGNVVTLERLAVDLASVGKFEFGGTLEIDDNWSLRELDLSLNVPDMDVGLFAALWPRWAAPNTRSWVSQNIPSGRVHQAKLLLAADLDTPEGVRKVHDFEGDLKLRNAGLIWASGSTPFSNVDADLHWNKDHFTASILKGRINDVAVQRGRVVIEPVFENIEKDAVISLNAKGGASTVMKLARAAGLTKYGSFDFSQIQAEGEVEFAMEATVPLGRPSKLARQIRILDATISNGKIQNLPNQMSVEDAELVINILPNNSQISGTAIIYGAPSEFNLAIDHQKNHVNMVGQTPPSPFLAAAMAKLFDVDIAGAIGGKIVYSGDPSMGEAKIGVTADLGNASINLPELDWAKLPAEDGRATLTITLRGGQIASLQNLDMAAGSLSAKGQVIFDSTGQVQAALFDRVAWPGNDIRDLIIERNGQDLWKVGATARLVNLVPLRRNEGVSGGRSLIFDFTAEQIVVDNAISLSGQLSGRRGGDGVGTANFLGTMLAYDKPLITDSNLIMQFGKGTEQIEGTGVIGGGEVELSYDGQLDAGPELEIVSSNAGRVLSGLGITDAVRGGKIRLKNTFNGADFKSYDTKIDLEKFRVVEAPRALRAFSVLSLAGLYSLVEGDGTAFRKGQAILETRGSEVKILKMRASGEAVGVTMLGRYNRISKKVDVSGNLVPANQISNLLGELPILGGLIAGTDKSGVFVTQFKVTGTSDDLKTMLDPVTSVAPGVLRDLFSPNWLNREEERLFGNDKPSTNQPQ